MDGRRGRSNGGQCAYMTTMNYAVKGGHIESWSGIISTVERRDEVAVAASSTTRMENRRKKEREHRIHQVRIQEIVKKETRVVQNQTKTEKLT